jgi:hypothetical protein
LSVKGGTLLKDIWRSHNINQIRAIGAVVDIIAITSALINRI